jgi:O-antigen ligase
MRHYLVRLIIVFLIGSALFSLFTYILFVSGTAELQGPLYHWFRDIAVGKITEVTTYYYRIVLAENLLITPILLVISSLLMRDEKHHKMWRVLFLCGAVILALNFSRAYLLAFAVGLLFLKYKHKVLRWFIVSAWSVAMIVLIFMSILIISSKGKSFGFEIIGIRISSLIQPITETSSNIRMALLEPIETLILQHPIIGNGLGSTFTYIDPRTYTEVTTSQFDWGYLEMWAELGIGGALCLLTIVGFLIYELIKKIRSISDYHDLYVGLLGGVIALLVMNITSPALYHVLGIFFLTFIIAFASKADGLFDETVTLLYRVFNRLKVHPDSKLR